MVLFFWGALSDERTGLSFFMLLALASVVFLGSESLSTRDHILLSQIRDFPFRRLLRLAGSQWRYSTPPPQASILVIYSIRTDGVENTISKSSSLVACISVVAETCLPSRSPAAVVYSCFSDWCFVFRVEVAT
jgi:hypothetical protein